MKLKEVKITFVTDEGEWDATANGFYWGQRGTDEQANYSVELLREFNTDIESFLRRKHAD